MLAAIGQVLPLAIAGALSSVPIAGVLTLLLGARRLGPAILFALGYVATVFVATLVATTLFSTVLVPDLHLGKDPTLGVFELVLGGGAVLAGAVLCSRPARTEPSRMSTVLSAALGTVRPGIAFAVGAVLAVRPKALLLAAGVGIVLAPADVPPGPAVALLAVSAVLTAGTVIGPIVFAVVGGDSARGRLEEIRAWSGRNSRAVTLVVLFLVGAVLVGDGLGRF